MRYGRYTVLIARPKEAVFDFFVDFAQASSWRAFVRTMERLDEGPLCAGSRVHVTMDVMGGDYSFDLDVLAVERPSLWRHRADETDVITVVEYRFASEGAGTRVTMTIDFQPRGLYGWLAVPLILMQRGKPYRDQLPHLRDALETR